MSETSLRGIQPAELDEFWPVAEPLLALGLKHGAGYRWTLPALRTAIAENRAYLWLTWPDLACAVITQIHDYPRAKVLDILWVCGRLPENWRGRVVYLEDWARGLGCTEVETGGRAGWARKLGECGYTPVPWITLRKPL